MGRLRHLTAILKALALVVVLAGLGVAFVALLGPVTDPFRWFQPRVNELTLADISIRTTLALPRDARVTRSLLSRNPRFTQVWAEVVMSEEDVQQFSTRPLQAGTLSLHEKFSLSDATRRSAPSWWPRSSALGASGAVDYDDWLEVLILRPGKGYALMYVYWCSA